jgi:hypothetical protein
MSYSTDYQVKNYEKNLKKMQKNKVKTRNEVSISTSYIGGLLCRNLYVRQ